MDEKEFLEKERKKSGLMTTVIVILFIVSPPLIVLSIENGIFTYGLVALVGAVMVYALFIAVKENLMNRSYSPMWMSFDKVLELRKRVMLSISVCFIVFFLEMWFFTYIIFGLNIFHYELSSGFLFLVIVALTYPMFVLGQKMRNKMFGKNRDLKVRLRKKDAEEVVEKALRNLNIDYRESEKPKWNDVIKGCVELRDGMKITVWPNGNWSRIQIYRIPEDERKEREIEREILRLVEKES